MSSLDGKVALVTGAARGMGRAHALRLAREGATIAIVDVVDGVKGLPYETATQADLDETVSMLRSVAQGRDAEPIVQVGDLRDPTVVSELMARIQEQAGRLDIAVINHGVWDIGNYWEITEEDWATSVDINLTSVWRVAKAVSPLMFSQRSGRIVITASIAALRPIPRSASYIATKAGVVGLTQALALEAAPYDVNVNAIAPGPCDTPINDHQLAWDMMAGQEHASREARDGAVQGLKLPRTKLLSPEVMADAMYFLVSEASRDITGVVLPVDAGSRW